MSVSLSSEIGSVSLLERENATVLNAALIEVARTAFTGFAHAIRQLQIPATLFLGQNDGSLMSVDYASPVSHLHYRFRSSEQHSWRSIFKPTTATQSSIDIGGTTTDIGILQKGLSS